MSLADILKLNEKDARWLQLEVCREYQKNKCTRAETECKFCHAPYDIEIENGRVTACYDSIRGRCNRKNPKCKYFHPPEHLKQQLLINGKKYLELKNAILRQVEGEQQQHQASQVGQVVLPQQVPLLAVNPYIMNIPGYPGTAPYYVAPRPNAVSIPTPYMYPQTYIPQVKTIDSYENLPYPGMLLYKKSVEYKPALFNPYITSNPFAYMKQPSIENYINHAKVSKGFYGQRLKKL